jgi:hypothetical protein
MPTPLPTITLFGATGGCLSAVLHHALSTGHSVNALVRTPSKLAALAAQHPATLHLTPGSIAAPAAVRAALTHGAHVADIVVCGIGMAMERRGLAFGSADPHVCEAAAAAILAALQALRTQTGAQGRGPRCVWMSTTGIAARRDVPLLMLPLYKWVLGVPHADKKRMEAVVVGSGTRWVLVRPSLLIDGKGKGMGAVKAGVEEGGKPGAVGYVISREDVGAWIFEECIASEEGEKWEGKIVGLTY